MDTATISRRSLGVVLIIALLGIGMVGTWAAPARDAKSFVEALVHEGLQTLADKQNTARSRDDRFARMLDEDFDVPRIARFVVGRYWSTTSEPDRQRFIKVFQQWVIQVYGNRLARYGGETVKITGSRPDSEAITTVASQVTQASGAAPTKIDWRVRRDSGDDYRVVDVSVDGVSMLLTQREEFAAVIERNGGTVAGLTRTLEQKIASGDTSGGFNPPAMRQPSQQR